MSRAPRSRSGLPAFNRATPPHFPFFYPADVPPRCTVYSVWIGRSYCEMRTGFPALGSSAVRRPGRSSETAGPPVALPASARGFRAGVLSLLYSGDQSASSFLERPSAFSAARLPSPRYGFARSAPLRAVLNFSSRIPRPLRISSPIYLSLSLFLLLPCPMRRQDSAIATRPASTDKFHASYTTSSSPVPPRRGLNGTRPRTCVLSPASRLEEL